MLRFYLNSHIFILSFFHPTVTQTQTHPLSLSISKGKEKKGLSIEAPSNAQLTRDYEVLKRRLAEREEGKKVEKKRREKPRSSQKSSSSRKSPPASVGSIQDHEEIDTFINHLSADYRLA